MITTERAAQSLSSPAQADVKPLTGPFVITAAARALAIEPMSQNSPKLVIPYDQQKHSDRNLRLLSAVCSSQERATPGPVALGTPLTLGFLRKDSFSLNPYPLLSKQLTQHSRGLQPSIPPTTSLLNVRLVSIKLGRAADGTRRFFNPSASCCRVIETCQKQARNRITRPPCQRLSYGA